MGLATPTQVTELSDAEIRSKIAQADQNPTDRTFNRDLGISLYKYAAMKQDVSLLGESARILERYSSNDPKDFDVLVALGNAHFDIGFYEKDAAKFAKAREVYGQALKIRPGEPDVSTDLGLTYFLQEPPDHAKAAAELEKVGASNASHERSRQFLVQTYIKAGRLADAERTLQALRGLNSSHPMLGELTAMLEAEKGKGK